MKVYLNEITGLADAAVSLLLSKRSWTREKEINIRKFFREETTIYGTCATDCNPSKKFCEWMDKIIKYGVQEHHTEILRGIEFSFTVEGLHRAGQDDWDAHVRRFQQCVRSSTRLAEFSNGEKSDYYQGKILYPFEALEKVGWGIPTEIKVDGYKYVITNFGYVREDLKDDKDVKRGLYPLAIPSNFTFKCTYADLGHIIQLRDSVAGNANPEVQQVADEIKRLVTEANNWLGENLNKIQSDPGDLSN